MNMGNLCTTLNKTNDAHVVPLSPTNYPTIPPPKSINYIPHILPDVNSMRIKGLEDISLADCKAFTFEHLQTKAKVLNIYDGDTCTCAFNTFGLGIFKHKIRLSGIDTAEMKDHDQKIKTLAKKAKEFLVSKIENKIVFLKCYKSDMYGRILADIFIDGEDKSMSQLLIDNGFALPYDGKKKGDIGILL